MAGRLLIIACMLMGSISVSSAQTPPPDALTAARSLVTTMKLADQYKALLPAIADAFAPYYTSMVDGVATIYANNFSAAELRDIEAFYRQPTGQKLLEKSPAIAQQAAQVGQDIGRKASDDLRARLTEALRQKGHKL